MKKFIVFLGLLWVAFSYMQAQEKAVFQPRYSLGVNVGFNKITSLSVGEKSWYPTVGIMGDYEFAKTWHLQAYVRYFKMEVSDTWNDWLVFKDIIQFRSTDTPDYDPEKIKDNYWIIRSDLINIPVMVSKSFLPESPLSPFISLGLSLNMEYNTTFSTKGNTDYFLRDYPTFNKVYTGLEAVVGLEYQTKSNFSVALQSEFHVGGYKGKDSSFFSLPIYASNILTTASVRYRIQ